MTSMRVKLGNLGNSPRIWGWCCAGLLLVTTASGCRGPRTAAGAGIGGALGGVAGAVVGHQGGNTLTGAALGATTGAVAGGLIGQAEDLRAERDEARHEMYLAAYRQDQWDRAVASDEVLRMLDEGVSEDLVCDLLRERGSRFDDRPENILYLTRRGTSERVIRALQESSVLRRKSRPAA
ncbi:MAG: glycine zipper domain-containing protein [Planctomycetaceae bacterium]